MTPLFSRRLTIVLPVLMLLFILSACQAAGTPAFTQAAGVPTTPQAAGVPAATQAPTLAAATPTSTQAAGGPPLPAQKPAARQLTITKTGDVPEPAPVYLAEVDGAAYARRGENPCIANSIVAGDTLAQRYEPAGLLTGVIGADPAESATVNGSAAAHYTFDERALGQAGLAKSTGEMWVASKGGYIVKYLLATKGGADYFGEGIIGTLTWDYELTGANQPVALKLPKDCPAGMVDVPLLPGAANSSSRPGNLTFNVSTSLADAAAFYEKQIPTLGWKAAGAPNVSDTSVLLDFTQADKTLTVILTSDKGVTTVDILLTR